MACAPVTPFQHLRCQTI